MYVFNLPSCHIFPNSAQADNFHMVLFELLAYCWKKLCQKRRECCWLELTS